MELTPKVFRDVQFREKLRGGYHPEDVDEFLEQAALAAETLQERVRQLTERAQRAEQAATDASATDDALRRMLLIAQKTADQAVREAREEAERLLAEAKRQATLVLTDAEESGRRTYERAIAEGQERMAELERALGQRQQEVEALQGWVEVQKGHLVQVLREAGEAVANAGLSSEPPVVPPATAPPGTSVAEADSRRTALGDAAAEHAVGDSGATVPVPVGDDTGEVVDVSSGSVLHSQTSGPQDATGLQEVPQDAVGRSKPASDGPSAAAVQRDEGKWDPSYLDNLGASNPRQPERAQAGRVDVPTPQPQGPRTYFPAGEPGGQASAVSQPTLSLHAPASQASPARSPEDDETLAFDERALDSFFSEQELGDDRGLGRFRRRS